jgi:hypothetical protein
MVYDYATQTAEFEGIPDEVPYLRQKDGIDAEAPVEEDQLFHFDRELMEIVGTIVAKIQEQSSLDVCDEEETAAIGPNKEAIATSGRPRWRSSKRRGRTPKTSKSKIDKRLSIHSISFAANSVSEATRASSGRIWRKTQSRFSRIGGTSTTISSSKSN